VFKSDGKWVAIDAQSEQLPRATTLAIVDTLRGEGTRYGQLERAALDAIHAGRAKGGSLDETDEAFFTWFVQYCPPDMAAAYDEIMDRVEDRLEFPFGEVEV